MSLGLTGNCGKVSCLSLEFDKKNSTRMDSFNAVKVPREISLCASSRKILLPMPHGRRIWILCNKKSRI